MIECMQTQAGLRQAVEAVLTDKPRSRIPDKFTSERVTQIMASVCEAPADFERDITRRTGHHELAHQARKWRSVTSTSSSESFWNPSRGRLPAGPCDRRLGNLSNGIPDYFAVAVCRTSSATDTILASDHPDIYWESCSLRGAQHVPFP